MNVLFKPANDQLIGIIASNFYKKIELMLKNKNFINALINNDKQYINIVRTILTNAADSPISVMNNFPRFITEE